MTIDYSSRPVPPEIAAEGGELIAFASSHACWRTNWTDIEVYYLHRPKMGSRPWLARVIGCSSIPGQKPLPSAIAAGTLERALKIVQQTGQIGVIAVETARQWADENRVTIENGRGKPVEFATDQEALEWLYGQPDAGLRGYEKMLARDTGAGESTIRMQMKGARPVMVPLRSLLPFIDRAAWRRAKGGDRG
jgi:hypothetical protein